MSDGTSSKASQSPQLEQIRREVEEASERARRLVSGLSEEQLRRRPQPGRWSVAECLTHLRKSSEVSLPPLDAALAEARERNLRGDGPFRMDFVGGLLKWSLEPPYRMKVKTTAAFEPAEIEPVAQVLPRFLESQAELLARLDRASGLALDQVKLSSAFNPRVRYNAFAAFHIMLAHVRRHLWQGSRLRPAPSTEYRVASAYPEGRRTRRPELRSRYRIRNFAARYSVLATRYSPERVML